MALSKQDRHTLATHAKGKTWYVLSEEPGFQPKGIGARLCRRMPKPYGWTHVMFGHPEVLQRIATNQNEVDFLCDQRDKLIAGDTKSLNPIPLKLVSKG
jgi:hypothetical protein